MKTLNCLVFDDHPLVGIAIKSTLKSLDFVGDIHVVDTTKAALNVFKTNHVDLIILNINLSDGYDFHRRVKSHCYRGKVLFYSSEESPLHNHMHMALKVGADGYVCKSEQQDVLKEAIEAIANGYTFFKFKSNQFDTTRKVALSNREATVMKHLLCGKSNKEIAAVLSISDKTVSTYKQRLLNKYGVTNLMALNKVVEI